MAKLLLFLAAPAARLRRVAVAALGRNSGGGLGDGAARQKRAATAHSTRGRWPQYRLNTPTSPLERHSGIRTAPPPPPHPRPPPDSACRRLPPLLPGALARALRLSGQSLAQGSSADDTVVVRRGVDKAARVKLDLGLEKGGG